MGVQGLWELLAPVGRRVSVETLAGKKLAIDASIWMVQFMKAMRDDKGEMVRNAHILGFFRRICKLLFLRTKPVFVFDGATPALKRRTVIARRRQRENAQAKIRKTAEKLLLNHLKATRLKELANDLASQTQKNDAKGKKVIADQIEMAGNAAEGNNTLPFSCNQEALDEMLAASLAAEEGGSFSGNASASGMGIPTEEDEEEEDEDEEMVLPAINGKVDPAVLAALPPSMQLDLLVQMRERLMAENRQKYQKVKKAPAKFSELQIQAYLKTVAFRREIDEVQKSATGKGVGGVQTSRIASEANREFIFSSSFTGDKQVLTSDGGNRHGEKLRQTPSVPSPSEPPDNIASTKNSNAESGSVANDTGTVFDGDVETYMDERGRVRVSRVRAMGIRMTRDLQRNLDLMKEIEEYRLLNNEGENSESNPDKNAGGVSRRLPDKIQLKETSCLGADVPFGDTNDKSIPVKNANLVEISFEDDGGNSFSDDDLFSRLVAGDPVMTFSAGNSPLKKHSFDSESDCDWEEGLVEEKGDSLIHDVKRESKVSLADAGDNDESEVEWADGNSDVLKNSSPASFESRKTISKGVLEEEADFQEAIKRSMEDLRGLKYSDASLEDEISNGAREMADVRGDSLIQDVKRESKVSLADAGDNDESEVEWVDGNSDVLKNSSPASFESGKTISKGVLEEEADFQEAVKRSMEDLRGLKYSDASLEDEISNGAREMANVTKSVGSLHQENDVAEPNMALENEMQTDISSHEVVSGVERLDSEARMKKLNTDGSPRGQLASSMAVNPDSIEGLMDKSWEMPPKSHAELFQQDTSEGGNLFGEIGFKESITHDKEKGVRLIAKKLLDTCNAGDQLSTSPSSSRVPSQISDVVLGETPQAIHADAQLNVFKAAVHYNVRETTEQGESSVKESTINHDSVQKLPEEKSHDNIVVQKGDNMQEFTSKDERKKPIEVTESSLEEEMLNLSKERIDLGDEQRKLERNAESASSEMFAECQELLQMFGLPYIIAPMEAEAQCAYMELANLVDGVVTDDSDVFLFGGRSVYKNIFDDRKYVETYFMKDIENELGLTREKLIRMALLLGSDYTEGVSGIGIVNAIEVVNAFPEEDGLSKFREWIESPDPTILGKLDVQMGSCSQKSRSKVGGTDESCSNNNMEGLPASDQTVSQTRDYNDNVKQNFMDKHRNVSKNWHIPSSFPNEAVISAYASPQVDKSTEAFSWGKPDLFVLRKLCWEKFGWSTQKADELLQPVLKEYNKHETQLRLEAFYTFNERFAKIRSKRIKKAVRGITGNKSSELMDDFVQEGSKSRKKSRMCPSEGKKDKSEKPLSGADDCVTRDESHSTERSTAKQSIKRKLAEPVPSEARNPEPLLGAKGKRNTRPGLSARGVRAVGRGRRKKDPGLAYIEDGSDYGSSSDYEQEMQVENLEGLHGVRKSTRTRKAVKYTLDDLEIDDPGKTQQDEENCSDEEAVQEGPPKDHGLFRDTASGPGEKNQLKVGDPSLGEDSSGDYLEIGGGFCIDEAEPELSLGQHGEPSFEAELSKEYLKMGGGFCSGKDGTNEDPDKCASEPAGTSKSDDAIPVHCSNFAVEADSDIGPIQLASSPPRTLDGFKHRCRTELFDSKQNLDHATSITNDDHSRSAMSPTESIRKDDSGTAPVKSLCAMPYLRRKRRKC